MDMHVIDTRDFERIEVRRFLRRTSATPRDWTHGKRGECRMAEVKRIYLIDRWSSLRFFEWKYVIEVTPLMNPQAALAADSITLLNKALYWFGECKATRAILRNFPRIDSLRTSLYQTNDDREQPTIETIESNAITIRGVHTSEMMFRSSPWSP